MAAALALAPLPAMLYGMYLPIQATSQWFIAAESSLELAGPGNRDLESAPRAGTDTTLAPLGSDGGSYSSVNLDDCREKEARACWGAVEPSLSVPSEPLSAPEYDTLVCSVKREDLLAGARLSVGGTRWRLIPRLFCSDCCLRSCAAVREIAWADEPNSSV